MGIRAPGIQRDTMGDVPVVGRVPGPGGQLQQMLSLFAGSLGVGY